MEANFVGVDLVHKVVCHIGVHRPNHVWVDFILGSLDLAESVFVDYGGRLWVDSVDVLDMI